MRTDKEIFKAFDKGLPKFKWFIKAYYPERLPYIEMYRTIDEVKHLLGSLNDIRFGLPDSKFNIKVNPPGWREFLNVIEE